MSNGRDGREPADLPVATVTNEFASATISIDRTGNGARLRIRNNQNGRCVRLDPLELVSLTWLTHRRLGPFLDPSQTGWSEHAEPARAGDGRDEGNKGAVP